MLARLFLLPPLFAAIGPCETTAQNAPNFVVIFTDDQGYGDLGCFGSETLSTPNLDRLAAEGAKLTSFYSTCGVCSPSRASLLTGCYYRRVGIDRVLFPASPIGLNPDETTIAEVLRASGYATACVGKWHLGDQPEFLPTRHGFDEFFGLPFSNDMHPPNPAREYAPLPLLRGEKVVETDPDQGELTRRYTEYAVDFIERSKDRPFLLYLPHSMPHRPCHASPPFMERFDDEQLAGIDPAKKKTRDFVYPAAIEELDWSVGRIVDTLEKLGLTERTLVLFTSDNGPAVGSAGPLRGRKGSAWEGGMRVPCIARWPGRIRAGSVCDQIASTIDVLPTLAKLAGADLPDLEIDGADIWPLLGGAPDATSPHDAFYYYRGPNLRAVRSGKWKLRFPARAAQELALFDLDADIGESTDVAADHPEVVARLRRHARRARRELGDGRRRGAGARPPGRVENPTTLTERRR